MVLWMKCEHIWICSVHERVKVIQSILLYLLRVRFFSSLFIPMAHWHHVDVQCFIVVVAWVSIFSNITIKVEKKNASQKHSDAINSEQLCGEIRKSKFILIMKMNPESLFVASSCICMQIHVVFLLLWLWYKRPRQNHSTVCTCLLLCWNALF